MTTKITAAKRDILSLLVTSRATKVRLRSPGDRIRSYTKCDDLRWPDTIYLREGQLLGLSSGTGTHCPSFVCETL